MKPPYIVNLAVQAYHESPKQWQNTISDVIQLNLSNIPQKSIQLLQPALSKSLDRNASYKSQTSNELLMNFAMQTNQFFGVSLLTTKQNTIKFFLRIGCVLLKMQRLDNDPTISKLIYDTGCIRSNLITKSIFQISASNLKILEKQLKDLDELPGQINIIQQILNIFHKMPESKIDSLKDIAKTAFIHIKKIYNAEYIKFHVQKAKKITKEFFLLFNDKINSFIRTKFFQITKLILSNKTTIESVDVEKLNQYVDEAFILIKNKNNGFLNRKNIVQYMKNINHAKTIIYFYQLLIKKTKMSTIIKLKKLIEILQIFKLKSPTNLNYVNSELYDLSNSFSNLSKKNKNNYHRNVNNFIRNMYIKNIYMKTKKNKS